MVRCETPIPQKRPRELFFRAVVRVFTYHIGVAAILPWNVLAAHLFLQPSITCKVVRGDMYHGGSTYLRRTFVK